ncbi:RICIN domain-containing protein [Kitasatospora sp. NPDC048538]|uniref:RICIN domain-containing protein n=1 Tax=unclassified Kitasatospora TaxID=2633591 RepID=UPI003402C646
MNITKQIPGRVVRATAAAVTAVALAFTAGGTATATAQSPASAARGSSTVTSPNEAVLERALKGLSPVSPEEVQRILAQGGNSLAAGNGGATQGIGFNGAYTHIVNDNSNKCLAVPGGSTAQGTGLIQWPCGTWNDHYWTANYQFKANNFNWFHVVNYNSGQCLAVPGASTTAGTQVIQWPCGTWNDHYWAFGVDTGNGKLHIINYNSGQCLAVPGASTADGAQVIQWPCGTWADHYWH